MVIFFISHFSFKVPPLRKKFMRGDWQNSVEKHLRHSPSSALQGTHDDLDRHSQVLPALQRPNGVAYTEYSLCKFIMFSTGVTH